MALTVTANFFYIIVALSRAQHLEVAEIPDVAGELSVASDGHADV